eukprot:1699304-Rhodomonas_salina.2
MVFGLKSVTIATYWTWTGLAPRLRSTAHDLPPSAITKGAHVELAPVQPSRLEENRVRPSRARLGEGSTARRRDRRRAETAPLGEELDLNQRLREKRRRLTDCDRPHLSHQVFWQSREIAAEGVGRDILRPSRRDQSWLAEAVQQIQRASVHPGPSIESKALQRERVRAAARARSARIRGSAGNNRAVFEDKDAPILANRSAVCHIKKPDLHLGRSHSSPLRRGTRDDRIGDKQGSRCSVEALSIRSEGTRVCVVVHPVCIDERRAVDCGAAGWQGIAEVDPLQRYHSAAPRTADSGSDGLQQVECVVQQQRVACLDLLPITHH